MNHNAFAGSEKSSLAGWRLNSISSAWSEPDAENDDDAWPLCS
jgi:hypothetical protein